MRQAIVTADGRRTTATREPKTSSPSFELRGCGDSKLQTAAADLRGTARAKAWSCCCSMRVHPRKSAAALAAVESAVIRTREDAFVAQDDRPFCGHLWLHGLAAPH